MGIKMAENIKLSYRGKQLVPGNPLSFLTSGFSG